MADALAARFELPESVAKATKQYRDGQVIDLWRRHVRFAREKAEHLGYVTSERRGDAWKLTEAGRRGLQYAQPAIVVEVLAGPNGAPRAARINLCVGLPTTHLLAQGDARKLNFISDGEIPLIITSIPYFDLKKYDHAPGQLGEIHSYESFLDAMEAVLRECQRVLIPGGASCAQRRRYSSQPRAAWRAPRPPVACPSPYSRDQNWVSYAHRHSLAEED